MTSNLTFALHEQFDARLLNAFAALVADRNKDDPWQGRWDINDLYSRWKFAARNGATALLACAWRGDRLLGTISLRPVAMQCHGKSVRAGELGDLYVDVTLRGQGVFSRFIALMQEGAARHGYEFVFSAPNAGGFSALLSSGSFRTAKRAEKLLSFLPVTPSVFVPPRLRELTGPADSLLRGWLGRRQNDTCEWVSWDSVLHPLPDFRGEGVLHSDLAALGARLGDHPDCAKYKILYDREHGLSKGWCIGKEMLHRERKIVFVAMLQAPTPALRRALLRSSVAVSVRDGASAIALWADRARLTESVTLATPFIPISRKRIAVLNTPFSEALLRRDDAVQIELLDTDKI